MLAGIRGFLSLESTADLFGPSEHWGWGMEASCRGTYRKWQATLCQRQHMYFYSPPQDTAVLVVQRSIPNWEKT